MTTLPIDYASFPMKAKYLIDETPLLAPWFIFGENPVTKAVDIYSMDIGDIFFSVPRDVADRILQARSDFLNVLTKELCY